MSVISQNEYIDNEISWDIDLTIPSLNINSKSDSFVVNILNQILSYCSCNNYKLNLIHRDQYLIETEEYYIILYLDTGINGYYYCTNVYFILKHIKILTGESIKIEDKYFKKLSLRSVYREENLLYYLNNIKDKITEKLNSINLSKRCSSCKELTQFCYCYKSTICSKCNKPYFFTYTVLKNNKLYHLDRNSKCQDCSIDDITK